MPLIINCVLVQCSCLFIAMFYQLCSPSSGGQIGNLCVKSFCERIMSEANDMSHDGNTLLDTEEINILVVLRMNREFIQHMREIYTKLRGQNFNVILV